MKISPDSDTLPGTIIIENCNECRQRHYHHAHLRTMLRGPVGQLGEAQGLADGGGLVAGPGGGAVGVPGAVCPHLQPRVSCL